MSNIERLGSLVDAGELRIIHMEAVPRSISTALARALSESDTPSISINEPFNRMQHDINDASGRILEVVEPTIASLEEPLTIVTKNMARNLSMTLFEEWMSYCDGVVWSVRDPVLQIGSLLTRVANDLAVEPGADKFSQDELTDEQIKSASDFLENGPKSTNFSKTSWREIGEHFDSNVRPKSSVVVDGTEFTSNTYRILSGASLALGLKFSKRMISGWQGSFINANTGYSLSLSDEEHAWTREAATSTGIFKPTRLALELGRLPATIREHLEKIATPTYTRMMNSSEHLTSKV